MLSYEQLSFDLTSRKHSTDSFIHFPAPTLSPMLLAAYASSKEVIYITTTQIQKSSLDCIQIGSSNYMGQ
ncbi:unnamed protein product [Brassica rapa subsp. trilocularis]